MVFNFKLTASVFASLVMMGGCSSFGERADNAAAEREANPGPCPRAFTLYETSRLVEFRGDGERFENVGFTGEINKVRSLCRYFGTAPINANIEVDMNFGRGPAATEATHTYYYFVAVTRKNIEVIEKQYFPVEVTFPAGVDRMSTTQELDDIIISRAKETTSGANFEIIVGFDLTPPQVEFNRAGKRFRVSAGAE